MRLLTILALNMTGIVTVMLSFKSVCQL